MISTIVSFFEEYSPVEAALIAAIFTWFCTALGASVVFFIKKFDRTLFDVTLGFAAGIMLGASFFSLLLPSIEMTNEEGFAKVIPTAIGFILGAIFIYSLDKLLPHLHINFKEQNKEGIKTPWHKSVLLTLAITLHNIPEGLAIGILFGGAALGVEGATIAGAVALTIGMAIQNIPEGFAVAMPLKGLGLSNLRSFNFGQLSAIVEPIAAIIGAWAVASFIPIMPYALGFAAGAMIFVVVEEVVPESQQSKNTDKATMALIIGFVLMMVLDVGLN